MAGKVILRIAYGIDVKPRNDPYVELAEKTLHSIALGSTMGGLIFDLVPFRTFYSTNSFLYAHRLSEIHALVVSWSWIQERS
jgi:hypothetical protein